MRWVDVAGKWGRESMREDQPPERQRCGFPSHPFLEWDTGYYCYPR